MSKNIVLGVSGGIAVYKVCSLVRLLKKAGHSVDVIMTKNATEFVTPLTFQTLSQRPVITDTFKQDNPAEVMHIALAQKADLFVVVPATANVIAKYAHGIADDMLTTTLLATTAPVVFCPAMNTNMLNNAATQSNLQIVADRGVHILDSDKGVLACGDEGKGRLPDAEVIYSYINDILYPNRDLSDKNVLITCGATLEKLDDVRFITNFSSGKMGCALAKEAQARGANVTLVLARHSVDVPQGVKVVNVQTTQEMHDKVMEYFDQTDAFIMAAAPCDYRPATFSNSKIKTESLTLNFVKNVDIAQAVGAKKGNKVLVAFSAETDNEIANATNKRIKKNADFIVCNNVKANDVFASDTNVVSIIDKDGVTSYDKMSKDSVAGLILDKLAQIL